MVRKYLISVFVLASFAAYVMHDKGGTSTNPGLTPASRPVSSISQAVPVVTIYPTTTDVPTPTSVPSTAAAKAPLGPIKPTTSPDATATHQPAPTRTQPPPPTDTPEPTVVAVASGYKDGQFTGNVAAAYYGPMQVKVVIQKGKITDVQVLDYPHDRRRSADINSQALPWLHDEAISAQSAEVDMISGATLTSRAYIESLQTALQNAKS